MIALYAALAIGFCIGLLSACVFIGTDGGDDDDDYPEIETSELHPSNHFYSMNRRRP